MLSDFNSVGYLKFQVKGLDLNDEIGYIEQGL